MKGCPCVGASLYSLRVPAALVGELVNTSHVIPQCGLAALTLVGGGAGDGWARARAGCEPGLLLCSVANITLLGAGAVLKLLDQKP